MDGSLINTIDIGAVLINVTSIILTAIVAFVVMHFTNKTAKMIQKRNEKNILCDDTEVLLAEYCTLFHKLFKLSKEYRKLYLKSELTKSKADELLSEEKLSEIESINDNIDTIIFKIDMKTKHMDELSYIVLEIRQLKEMVASYALDHSPDDCKKTTSELRNKFSECVKKYKDKTK